MIDNINDLDIDELLDIQSNLEYEIKGNTNNSYELESQLSIIVDRVNELLVIENDERQSTEIKYPEVA